MPGRDEDLDVLVAHGRQVQLLEALRPQPVLPGGERPYGGEATGPGVEVEQLGQPRTGLLALGGRRAVQLTDEHGAQRAGRGQYGRAGPVRGVGGGVEELVAYGLDGVGEFDAVEVMAVGRDGHGGGPPWAGFPRYEAVGCCRGAVGVTGTLVPNRKAFLPTGRDKQHKRFRPY